MLDNILNSVRQGVEKVQRRGEEVAQVARLKMEVFQLGRDLDAHFARLGRAYHSGADADLLQTIREEIQRTEEDIAGREQLIAELGDDPGDTPSEETPTSTVIVQAQPQVSRTASPAPPPLALEKSAAAQPEAPTPATRASDTGALATSAPAAEVTPTSGNRPAFVSDSSDPTDT